MNAVLVNNSKREICELKDRKYVYIPLNDAELLLFGVSRTKGVSYAWRIEIMSKE